jgi:hypothetical protein
MNDQAIQLHPQHEELSHDIVASLILDGDIAALNNRQRVDYYVYRCRTLLIDPAEQPFALIKLDGKLTLYPKKECAQALTRIHRLSVEIMSRDIDADGFMTVCARAKRPDGSFVDDDGVLDLKTVDVVGGLNEYGKKIKGIGIANARMKCSTKAKRRAVLGLCGLGGADVEDIAGARICQMNMETGEITEGPEAERAIDVGSEASAVERITMLVAEIANANGTERRKVYEAAVRGSGIPFAEYDDGFPWRAGDLTDEDANAIASWLELNRKTKRAATSDARPRPRPEPPQVTVPREDDDVPF